MRSLFWVLAALFVVLGVMSTNLWRGLRAERELAASLHTQIAAAASPAPTAAPPEPTAAASAQPPAEPVMTYPRERASLQEYRKSQVQAQAPQSELWKDEEYRKARVAQARVSLAASYPDLAVELGLSAAELDRVFGVLATFQVDMDRTMSSLTDTSDRLMVFNQGAESRLQELSRQRDAELSSALGPARFAQWQQYQQSMPVRRQVGAMSAKLAQAGQAMNVEQKKALTAALEAETRQQQQEMANLSREINKQDPAALAQVTQTMRERQQDFNERILVAASRVLTPQQLQLVRAQFDQQAALTDAAGRALERAVATQAGR